MCECIHLNAWFLPYFDLNGDFSVQINEICFIFGESWLAGLIFLGILRIIKLEWIQKDKGDLRLPDRKRRVHLACVAVKNSQSLEPSWHCYTYSTSTPFRYKDYSGTEHLTRTIAICDHNDENLLDHEGLKLGWPFA